MIDGARRRPNNSHIHSLNTLQTLMPTFTLMGVSVAYYVDIVEAYALAEEG